MFVRHTLLSHLHSCTVEKTVHRAWGRWDRGRDTVGPYTWPKAGMLPSMSSGLWLCLWRRSQERKAWGRHIPREGLRTPGSLCQVQTMDPGLATATGRQKEASAGGIQFRSKEPCPPGETPTSAYYHNRDPEDGQPRETPRDGYPDGPW